jgi:hypothetical protein
MRTLLHNPADTGTATGESSAGAVAFNSATIKRRMAYALAGLAVLAAVMVALAAAPGPAQAQSSGAFCIRPDGGTASPGEIVTVTYSSYDVVYLCRDDGSLALLYRYCTGLDCPFGGGKRPILAYEPGFGGGGGTAGCSRGEIDYWFAYAYETDVFCTA